MKKVFFLVPLWCLLLAGCVRIPTQGNAAVTLQEVLHARAAFVDEEGAATYLTAAVSDGETAAYATVDLDGDGKEELVVDTASPAGEYLVLRTDGAQVKGYRFGYRSMQELKADGSFSGSDGAAITHYFRLAFTDTGYVLTEEGYANDLDGVYTIGGKRTTAASMDTFVNMWQEKPAATWQEMPAKIF